MMKSCLFYCFIIIYNILLKSCSSYEIPIVQLNLINNGFTLNVPGNFVRKFYLEGGGLPYRKFQNAQLSHHRKGLANTVLFVYQGVYNLDCLLLSSQDEPGIRNVFYVIKINEKCPAVMDHLMQPINNIWSTTQTAITLQNQDKLKISLLVNYNGEAYKSLQHIIVGENNNRANKTSHNPSIKTIEKCNNSDETQTSQCDKAQTTIKGQTKNICRNQLIFEENFDTQTLDKTKWSYDIRNLLTGQYTEEFVIFDNAEENIFLSNGYLNIKPTVTKINMREASIDFGTRCTPVSKVRNECRMSPMPPHIYIPPINSSQINTKNSLRFKYGRIEIKAKLPKGDWLLPYIMLEYYGAFERKQIRIAFARGNDQYLVSNDSQDIGGRRLYGGIVKDEDSRMATLKDIINTEHYGNAFHIYTLAWTNETITLGVDGEIYGEIKENLSDFKEEFFLTLGVSAGGHLEFPENLQNVSEKPWENTSPRAIQYLWQSFKDGKILWNDAESVMQIDYVRIYAL